MSHPTKPLPKTIVIILLIALALFTLLQTPAPTQAGGSSPVYTDALASGWEDWSWSIGLNLANPNPVHGGTSSIAITYTEGWDGFQLGYHGAQLDVSAYDVLRFWVHGGSNGGQEITVQIEGLEQVVTATANTWTQVDISLTPLGTSRSVGEIVWWNGTANAHPTFYLDDIEFVNTGQPTPTPPPAGSGPALTVNAGTALHPISPYIYGMNYADPTLAADLQLPVNRWGGNATTRYNWQYDISNRGSDWYFENVQEDAQNGAASDHFIEQNNQSLTDSLITLPLIGWTPKNNSTACGFSIAKYGTQTDADWTWRPDCGNGVAPGNVNITGNDPLDTSLAITPAFVTEWVNHMVSVFGAADEGGVQFYAMDNEPMLWNSTHRDVHPDPTTYDEMRDRTYAYAAAVKAADPNAFTLGPVVWGWCAYFYSAADGCGPGADYQAHGNTGFVEWYLQQMSAYEQAHDVRILDYVDVHIYPQIDGVFSEDLGSAAVQAARLRSTRQLWDPTYVHEGWIGQPVYLIPRMKTWVADNYPGTKTAITEYNWGAYGYLNGALAQADLLGIFGREGLDLATLWTAPSTNQPVAYAFRMYRNYDGQHHKFGDTSVFAESDNQEQLAIYAAKRSTDGALTLIVINKTNAPITSPLTLTNFNPALNAQVYRYSAANLNAIVQQAPQPVSANGFTATYPANSITLFVIPTGTPLHMLYLPIALQNSD